MSGKWKETCCYCGLTVTWEAADFFDAADKHPTGWGRCDIEKKPICPDCKKGGAAYENMRQGTFV